ncbi:hypothetical protein ACFWYW_23225 [Nonomuraea sp. NPDC059023]|uniref:hypothetical protein n=1 Tax=unclassified Nonomuraea TaxID=2593643 RepID=UPI0036AD8BDF
MAAEMDLGLPRWADDPTPVFSTLISYADAADTGFDAPAEFAAAARERFYDTAQVYRVALIQLWRQSGLMAVDEVAALLTRTEN